MPPDRWLALTIHLPPEAEGGHLQGTSPRELIPHLLLELGGRGVEERADSFTTYLLPPEDIDGFLQEARAKLGEVSVDGGAIQWAWQPQEDWEELWRRGLGHRRITDRLHVAPTWDVPEVEEGQILLVLDPGMAFGTAEHATTRGCLRLLDSRVREGDRVADIGSGSGILSIAAALMGAGAVLAVESDAMSCEAALENLEANGVRDRVRILVEKILPTGPLPGGHRDGIVANIQSSILLPLLPVFRESLLPGGWLILSGILHEEREEVFSAASGQGLLLEEEDQEAEWWSGAFSRVPGSH